jgi:hypothetical protein
VVGFGGCTPSSLLFCPTCDNRMGKVVIQPVRGWP